MCISAGMIAPAMLLRPNPLQVCPLTDPTLHLDIFLPPPTPIRLTYNLSHMPFLTPFDPNHWPVHDSHPLWVSPTPQDPSRNCFLVFARHPIGKYGHKSNKFHIYIYIWKKFLPEKGKRGATWGLPRKSPILAILAQACLTAKFRWDPVH